MEIIIDPPGEPAHNMARDEELALAARQGRQPPTLRIYRWSCPAISIGRRQSLEELPSNLVGDGLPIVRRPTGGGAVLHRLDELTYALALPRNSSMPAFPLRQIPAILHRHLRDELVRRGFVAPEDLHVMEEKARRGLTPGDRFQTCPRKLCFESPVCGDLLCRGRKVAGSALRIWRDGLLLQGSIQDLPLGFTPLANVLIVSVGELAPELMFTHYTLISV